MVSATRMFSAKQRAAPNQRTCILKCMIAISHSRCSYTHTYIRVQYSAFSLTYVQFNIFLGLQCVAHMFACFVFQKKFSACSAWMCISLFFVRSFYPFHRVSRRAHKLLHRWSSYSICLSALMCCAARCFVFISLNWFAARFFWMNWVNGVSRVAYMYVLCTMRKSGSNRMNFHFI